MSLKNNRYVTIIKLLIINKGPLQVGNGDEGILIDEASNNPYLPATSISGAIRAYLTKEFSDKAIAELFGSGDKGSRIYISDSYATNKKEVEYRPGVRIDNKYGTNLKGGYFTRELLASGHEFTVEIKIFANQKEQVAKDLEIIKSSLSALNIAELRFGGNKTNGAGIFEINKLEVASLDLEKKDDFISYVTDKFKFVDKKREMLSMTTNNKIVKFILDGEVDTQLLIKGLDSLNHEMPDGTNMINAEGDYIFPGSSLKGAIRNAFNKIAKLKKLPYLTVEAFGDEADKNDDTEKKPGKIYFEDIKIENPIDNAIYNRIRIDAFTGGVRTGAILNDKPVTGRFRSKILFYPTGKEDMDKKIIAIMLLTLRDVLIGDVSFGSGNSIGRGKIAGNHLIIEMKGETLKLDLINKKHENIEKIQELVSSIN